MNRHAHGQGKAIRAPAVVKGLPMEGRWAAWRVAPDEGPLAGELGLEPRMTVPKTAVLPLHHSPAGTAETKVPVAEAVK